MRAILLGDLDAAARAVLAVPAEEWTERITGIIERAERAERYLAATGRFHVRDGNGSLGSAARKSGLVSARTSCDRAYLVALGAVIAALLERDRKEIPPVP
jgi:outer membrane lipopolysaccharide assembly protein LptE/RlpB